MVTPNHYNTDDFLFTEDTFCYVFTALVVKIQFVWECYRPAFRCRNG